MYEKKRSYAWNFQISQTKGENLASNFLIRDLRSAARSFLHNVAPFLSFWLTAPWATLEKPLEGVDFPSLVLSFTSTSDRGIKEGILTARFPINLVSHVPQLFWCRDTSKLYGMMYESSFNSSRKKKSQSFILFHLLSLNSSFRSFESS